MCVVVKSEVRTDAREKPVLGWGEVGGRRANLIWILKPRVPSEDLSTFSLNSFERSDRAEPI